MALNNENVISKLSRKNSLGFDTPYPIGTDAKYISGIRGTNVNNIEEQFLIGFDCIKTTSILEDGTEFIIEEFRDESIKENYYIIETYNFSENSKSKHFIKQNILYLPKDSEDNIFETQENNGSLTFLGINTSVYSFENNGTTLNIITEVPIFSTSLLKYQGAIGSEPINVAEKIIYLKENINGKIVQKQIIKNFL